MSTSQNTIKDIPIVMLGDIGVTFDPLQKAVSLSSQGICTRAPSMVDAFQLLINKGGGVLFIRMDDQQVLAEFAKIFQIAIRQLNLAQIKILISSTQNNILTNRALTQFPFVRTMSPIFDLKRLTTVLVNECQSLEIKSQKKKTGGNNLSSGIVVIKGEPQLTGHHFITGTPEPKPVKTALLKTPPWELSETPIEKEKILNECLGPHVPTFIYNGDLSWRVRGHYSSFQPQQNTVTFVVSHKIGAEKINEELKKSDGHFFSSTSAPKARVCSSLALLKANGLEFTFRTPQNIQGVQRRANQRTLIPTEQPILIQYADSRLGADRTLNVLDISRGGLGVRLDKDFVGDFEKGRKISNLSIILTNRIIRIPEAEVRHCSKSDLNPDFKILGLMTSGMTQTDLNYLDMFILKFSA